MITEETVVTIPKDVFYTRIDDASVILDLQTSKIFRLDEVGTRIWELLIDHDTTGLAPVMAVLLDEYDISREHLWAELTKFLAQLEEEGLIGILKSVKQGVIAV